MNRQRLTLDPNGPPLAVDIYARLARALVADDPREALLESTSLAKPRRSIAERRKYAGDPWRYFPDVLGWKLTGQQEEALELIEKRDWVQIPSGHGIGKSYLVAGYVVYRYDAVAALPDPDNGLEEQGCHILLLGPTARTVRDTTYAKILGQMRRAEERGFPMPGYRSERSVNAKKRDDWFMVAITPPRSVGKEVQHSASGLHHRNQVAIIEEALGVDEPVIRAVEGMCNSEGNKIVCIYNPTESIGPLPSRAKRGQYHTLHLSALDHPNVLERRTVIPGAVGHVVLEGRIRTECVDRGLASEVKADPQQNDFVYALPPPGAAEPLPRKDGRGHAKGKLRVYRPQGLFVSQVLGRFPLAGTKSLFDPIAWQQSVERWKESADPDRPPDRVGLDVGRADDGDATVGVPSWGPSGAQTLSSYAAAEAAIGEELPDELKWIRIRLGEPVTLENGDGPHVAQQVLEQWPSAMIGHGGEILTAINIDEGGVGASPFDHGKRVLRLHMLGVSFGAKAFDPIAGEMYCANLRTAMYVRYARLVALGLIDNPPDDELQQEIFAHYIAKTTDKAVKVWDESTGRWESVKKSVVQLIDKDEVIKRIGRSPNKADAAVMAVWEPPGTMEEEWDAW